MFQVCLLYTSIQLPAGSFTSLVGESGCGKSTIAGILSAKNRGFTGEIKIAGIPLSEIDEKNLMSHVVLIRHNSYLCLLYTSLLQLFKEELS